MGRWTEKQVVVIVAAVAAPRRRSPTCRGAQWWGGRSQVPRRQAVCIGMGIEGWSCVAFLYLDELSSGDGSFSLPRFCHLFGCGVLAHCRSTCPACGTQYAGAGHFQDRNISYRRYFGPSLDATLTRGGPGNRDAWQVPLISVHRIQKCILHFPTLEFIVRKVPCSDDISKDRIATWKDHHNRK